MMAKMVDMVEMAVRRVGANKSVNDDTLPMRTHTEYVSSDTQWFFSRLM
jgi:hypothetical protein